MPFVTVPEAVNEIRAGRILVVVDDEDRENEGDLTIAAEKVTPEIINFMAAHGRWRVRLAGLPHAGVTCEIMNDHGTLARVPQLLECCTRHGLKMISVADLIRHRLKHEKFVRRVATGAIQTEFGEFRTVAYTSDLNPE